MTLYAYHCPSCGSFDARFAIGTAPERVDCPDCSAASTRKITAPLIGHGNTGYGRAIERSNASADSPQVVTGALPGAARTAANVTRNPLHARLPRP